MEKDIAPELLEKIQKDFKSLFDGNQKIASLYARVRDGTATYVEAQDFALETGDVLAQAFKKHITADALPNGKMYYNIAKRILQPTLEENHALITDVAKQVQESLNKKAGIGLKAVAPEVNQERIDGLVNHLDHAESFEEVAATLDEPIKQHAMSVVNDVIDENAKFQSEVGLTPKLVRKAEAKCCEWCKNLAGIYEYSKAPNDVYKRHDNCRCTLDYVVGKERKSVHMKTGKKRKYVKDEYGTYSTTKEARIQRAEEMSKTEKERKKAARQKRIETWNKKKAER